MNRTVLLPLVCLAALSCRTDPPEATGDAGVDPPGGGEVTVCEMPTPFRRIVLDTQAYGERVGTATVTARLLDRLSFTLDGPAPTSFAVEAPFPDLDVAVGDTFEAHIGVGGPFWTNSLVEMRDAGGLVLAAANSDWEGVTSEFGGAFFSAVEIERGEPCPAPEVEGCVTTRYATHVRVAGAEAVLRPGEEQDLDTGASRLHVLVAESETTQDLGGCGTDQPGGWLGLLVYRTQPFGGEPAVCPGAPADLGVEVRMAGPEGDWHGTGGPTTVLEATPTRLRFEAYGAPDSPPSEVTLEGPLGELTPPDGEVNADHLFLDAAGDALVTLRDEEGPWIAYADLAAARLLSPDERFARALGPLRFARGADCEPAGEVCRTDFRALLAQGGEQIGLMPGERGGFDGGRWQVSVGHADAGCEGRPGRVELLVLRTR